MQNKYLFSLSAFVLTMLSTMSAAFAASAPGDSMQTLSLTSHWVGYWGAYLRPTD